MAQTVVINGVTYSLVPSIQVPLASGSGNASFYDNSSATISSSASLRNGVVAIGSDGTAYTGSMTEKSSATITPTSSDQTINANQYLAGAQTIEGVVCTNLSSAYIANGVTVKVGTATDDDSVTSVTGTLASPVISQDSTTKILTIS